MRTLVLGDKHGLHPLEEDLTLWILNEHGPVDRIVQVGDFGYYPNADKKYLHPIAPLEGVSGIPRYWIRGNHEDHEMLRPHYHKGAPINLTGTADWLYVPDCVQVDDMYFMGGAWSIDKRYRDYPHHPFRWHNNEQMDSVHHQKALDFFCDNDKVNSLNFIFTHDAPLSQYKECVNGLIEWADYTTPKLFDRILNQLCLRLDHEVTWAFGHLGKSHMNQAAIRDGAPLKWKIGPVNFLFLDMLVDYKSFDYQIDSWYILES